MKSYESTATGFSEQYPHLFLLFLQLRDHSEPEGRFSVHGNVHSEPDLLLAQRGHLGPSLPTGGQVSKDKFKNISLHLWFKNKNRCLLMTFSLLSYTMRAKGDMFKRSFTKFSTTSSENPSYPFTNHSCNQTSKKSKTERHIKY